MNAHLTEEDFKSREFESPLAGALYMVALGFAVFPLWPNAKRPYEIATAPAKYVTLTGGVNRATRDTRIIKSWIEIEPALNFGVSLTNSVVLDFDTKNGHELDALSASLELDVGWGTTFTVRSPSGGWHSYFQGPPSGQPRLLNCIDVKSRGGYVLAPGSRFGGGSYSIVNNISIAELPEAIRQQIGNALEKDRTRNKAPACEPDLPPT